MPFGTYTELKAAIATRLHRSDLTAAIVDYVALAEKRLNRDVQLVAQETETTLTAVVGSRNLTIPSLFGAPLGLYLTTYLPRAEIHYRLPTQMQVFSENGPASYWTVDGTVIKTDAPADIAYTYALRYRAEYNLAATDTNALLTNYPDLYFNAALIEAAADLQNDAMLQRYQLRYAQSLQECKTSENDSRSIAPLTTEVAAQGRSYIISGR